MKYNPAFLDEDTLVQSFVARQHELEFILEIVRENTGESNQHVLIVGPRGMGKTTLALRVVAETQMDEALSDTWYPIVFGEESYQVTTPGEFWLEALFQVGEQTGEQRWQESYEELRRESDEDRLRQRTLAQLMDFADEREKRLLMVVENLNMLIGDQVDSDEAWTLRHTLLNEPRIMLLGTATSRFEEIEESDKAMFDLFKIVDLNPIEDGEVQALWESVTGEKPAENEVRPIQILTGGNPRLIRIISEFAADTSFRDLMENLTQLVDEHTEYFKRHLDSLSPQERKVFVALADLWDPSTTREVAEAARLDPNRTSAVLGRLTDRGAVTVVDKSGRSNYYQVTERMYNIYHLMRRRGRAASRVRAVVRFMIHLYRGEELVDTVTAIAEEARELKPERRQEHFQAYEAVVSMTKDPQLEAEIIKEAGPLFSALPDAPQSIESLTPSKQEQGSEADSELGKKDLLEADVEEIDDVDTLLKICVASSEEMSISQAKSAYEKVVDIEPDNVGALIGLGGVRGIESNFQEALQLFERAIDIDPTIAISWFGKGVVLEALDRHEEALSAIDQALAIDGSNVEIWRRKVQVLMSLDRHEEALEASKHVFEVEEADASTWFNKGVILLNLGRYQKALEAFERVLTLDETSVGAWYNKGFALENLDQIEDALEAYDQALQIDETDVRSWHGKVGALVNLDQPEKALEAVEQALILDETNVSSWLIKGTISKYLHQYEKAMNAYEQAIQLDNSNSTALREKGDVLLETAEYRHALDTFESALDLDETDARAWLGKGDALKNLDQHEGALGAYDRALELDESLIWAWKGKGIILRELGRYDDALNAYDRALQLDEEDVLIWRIKGAILRYLRRYEKALDAFDKAIEIDETDSCTWSDKGNILNSLSRYEEALEAHDQALEIDESNVRSWRGRGTVLDNLGRYEKALESFDKALSLEKHDVWSLTRKGLVLKQLGRYEEAVDTMEETLDIDSELKAVWRTLLELYTNHLGKPGEALSTAHSYLETFDYKSEILNYVARVFYRAGWRKSLPQAETWARQAIEQEPDNVQYLHTLALILGIQDEWEEAFEQESAFLDDPEAVEETLDEAIEFFVAAAAAGQTQEALRCIQDSSCTEALEPLVVALKMDLGEDVTVAAEIKEVASDVLDRIEARREEQSD